jgi:hypothetical protein
LDEESRDASIHLIAASSVVRTSEPSFVHSDDPFKEVVTFPLVAVQQVLCNSITVPLLHLGNFMGYPTRSNFAVSKNVVQNVEHG